jgi:phenylacetate-coenzyme A ligase PaaK-like adenylate-forming protein
MINIETLLTRGPYSLAKEDKRVLFEDILAELTRYHYAHCPGYRKIIDALSYDTRTRTSLVDTPFLPVRIFKILDLLSVPKADVIKTMTSSGTSGQGVSKIYLDKYTATLQTKVLSSIVTETIGTKRLPMLIIDTPKVIADRTMFSARGAAINGFSLFSNSKMFALNDEMILDIEGIKRFLSEHADEELLVFGFTSLIWEHLYEKLLQMNEKLNLSRAILIHGGGWKKMADRNISNNTFKSALKEIVGIQHIYNYYGMVEQTGSIFLECSEGYLHASIYSDIIIRNKDFAICGKNERGVIESISLLPWSYPGHALLSEDIGEVFGEDNCTCGRLGKYFKVYGRLAKAELRGCSDTYE